MPSPRKIRETTVQFLYCSDLEGGADPTQLLGPFWDCVTESDRRRLLTAVFRSIHHLAQGRAGRIQEWLQRSENGRSRLAARPEWEGLAPWLDKLVRMEAQWDLALEGLQRLSLDGEDEVILPRLQSGLDEFFGLERELATARSQFLAECESLEASAGQFEALIASTRRLERISERLAMLEHPENFPEQADLAKLRDSKEELARLRLATEEHVSRIHDKRPQIDASLAAVVENYAPERINPVDRAILRLATSEILEGATPVKVAINEAVELAKRFGTGDSPRFVNGVLDKVASHLQGNSAG